MKIVAVADTHGNLLGSEIPECDLFILAGDFCPDGTDSFQECWLDAAFKYWCKHIPAKKKILVAGNHDFVFESRKSKALSLIGDFIYLQDDYCYFEDIKIYGLPWQLYNGGWAFNLYEHDLAQKYAQIPNDTDIIVSHGPPFGYGDNVPKKVIKDEDEEKWPEPAHAGSPSLIAKIIEIKPKLVVFGHIHQGYGIYKLGNTILANVACKPTILTLPPV